MRDQYAGDISDMLKFAFLRAITARDMTLGIAWYYSPGYDGRPDGRHVEWKNEPEWRRLDEELHASLSTLRERSIAALEQAAIWPRGTLFHCEPIPSGIGRRDWGERKRNALRSANIVFLDPDNGLGETKRHATFSEVQGLRQAGRTIIFITFPGRNKRHDVIVRELHERLKAKINATSVITLRTNVSVPSSPGRYVQRQRWFTVVDPNAELIARISTFARALTCIPRVTTRLDQSPA